MTHATRFAAVAVLVALAVGAPVQAQTPEIDALRARAEAGDAEAQFNLGTVYADGEGVPQDDAEAARWFRLAADQGHANAQTNLGIMYRYGVGVPQDRAEAVRWFRLAADQGLGEAQNNLGHVRHRSRRPAGPCAGAHVVQPRGLTK
jgi:TPR repeat protein